MGVVYFQSHSSTADSQILVANWMFVQPELFKPSSVIYRTLIKLQGFLFPVRILWLEDEISGFQVFGMLYNQKEIEGPFGPDIYLDGPDEDAQHLNQIENLFWMPLFATQEDIHGILVSKIFRTSTFRRLGRIQVPLLSPFWEVKGNASQSSNQNKRITRSTFNLSGNPRHVKTKDRRGERLIEIMKIEHAIDITLK